LDLQTLEKYDFQKMYQIYNKWPQIAKESYDSSDVITGYSGITHIVFAGMGGSGALGDVFSAILSKSKIHISIVKGYLLPKTVDSDSLVIITSVSGNTQETITVLNSAKKMNCKIISFSSGGKIQEYCSKNKIEHKVISQIHSPRASFTGYLYSMLKALQSILPIQINEINESIKNLEILGEQISSKNLSENNPSIKLAKYISGIPVVYYPNGLQAAAIRFKNSLQENSKIHVIIEDVIEACHNGIVAWEKPSTNQPILLQGDEDYIKTKERWKILKQYFIEHDMDFYEITSVKGGILTKLINLIYLLDYASIYRAVLSETDPSLTQSINYIKTRLQ
jgi:glucose/mannose-6-phosphate isomerase